MDKLITRKNLMIVNAVLGALLALVLFFGIVRPTIQAGPEVEVSDVEPVGPGGEVESSARPPAEEYDVITENDLFVSKLPKEIRKVAPKNYYDLQRVWKLEATFKDADGNLYAIIRDKGQPDAKVKRPYTIYEVRKGDIIEGETAPRIYKAEIRDVQKDFVVYYRLDMEDRTEDERTFKLPMWD